ncbi:MAG: phosphatidate cytidylyltransferase [Bacillota bacterium]|nr:phosphatidate cytidylyltransferase [Bacillota bacterium]
MKTRVISAIIALPILFFVLLTGGISLYVSTFLLSLIGLYEFYKAFSKKYQPVKYAGYIVTAAWFLGYFANFSSDYFTFLIALFLFFIMALTVFTKQDIMGSAITFIGFFYVTFALSHIIMISEVDNNFFIWYPFIIAFITDTFAYLTGKLIGKTPLIPSVSPNKTVEGSIGGIVACLIFSFIYARIWNPDFQIFAIFLGLVGSMLSQVGDLIASKIKRVFEIKDFGKIMPGHGGVLDRFDSLLITLPLVYYFIVLYGYIRTVLV